MQIMNNLVAKYCRRFNKSKVEVDKKKKLKFDRKISKNNLKKYTGESPSFFTFFIYRYNFASNSLFWSV